MTPRQVPSRDSETTPSSDAPLTPSAARDIFGENLPRAERYVDWLSGPGLERGLMGPREKPRLWDRHVLNSAAVAQCFVAGETVIDIGSGAGLPGIPLALARPDLSITLVEPLLRRVNFLQDVVADLGLEMKVIRGRAEEDHIIKSVGGADAVTSRAVAPLAKLAKWSVPLLRPEGRMLALKGTSATDELEKDSAELSRMGLKSARVQTIDVPGAEPTWVVMGSYEPPPRAKSRRR